MKPLQLTLFMIANAIFIIQAARQIHTLAFFSRPSVREKKISEVHFTPTSALLHQYRTVDAEIGRLEKSGMNVPKDLCKQRESLDSELWSRDYQAKEVGDLWFYSGVGIALIASGTVLYRRGLIPIGLSTVATGFAVVGYWTHPGSGYDGHAPSEVMALLVGRVLLSFAVLALLHLFWFFKDVGTINAAER